MSLVENQENSVAENQNNENISRERGLAIGNGTETTEVVEKKKKSKKRVLTESEPMPVEEPAKKKKKKSAQDIVEDATVTTACQDDQETSKFDWKLTILELIGSNEEMSLKKLRKKVCTRYVNHRNNTITLEKAVSRFEKKLPKITEVSVKDNIVRLC